MSRGVNKVILVGNLGGDPETRHTSTGTSVCKINIATSEQWTDKQSGEKQERTEWHRVTFFGRLAEIADEYLKKGRQVYIEGSLRTDKYTDKEGIERYSTNVIASEMQMLGGAPGEGAGEQRGGQRGEQRSSSPRSNSGGRGDYGNRAPAPAPADSGFADDEIPF